MSLAVFVFLSWNTVAVSVSQTDHNVNKGFGAPTLPFVISTWSQNGFSEGCRAAWNTLESNGSRLDAVEIGCARCEQLQCDGTVGFGGSPDEKGSTTLDAMIMDGPAHRLGAVGGLTRVRNAAAVARAVMERTKHSFLVGTSADSFASEMGFKFQNLSTPHSMETFQKWKSNSCQPNYRLNVQPDPRSSCGPYKPTAAKVDPSLNDSKVTDTIAVVVIDSNGDVAVGTSTNGASHKVPGRVGDSPIPGAGAYLDNDVGGAGATGDGDVMMRFLPTYQTVEYMRQGLHPSAASRKALERISRYYPNFSGGIVAATKNGDYGAACHGMKTFPFTIRRPSSNDIEIKRVQCYGAKIDF